MRHKRPRSTNEKRGNSILLRHLQPNIVCRLCRGYIIECVTIVECMHSFCKSCIVKYLNAQEEHFICPKCGQLIHESNPWSYLAPDSALQTIIYKLVPGLQENETRRCTEYYKRRGISPPRKEVEPPQEKVDSSRKKPSTEHKNGNCEVPKLVKDDHHRMDEQISVHLIAGQLANKPQTGDDTTPENPSENGKTQMFRPYLRLSCFATVNHLRKYLAYRIFGDIDRYAEFELFCNGHPLFKEHTLKFISATVWGIVIDAKEKSSIDLIMPIVYRTRTTSITADGTDEDNDGDAHSDCSPDISALSKSVSSPV